MQRISITNPQNIIDGTAKKYYFKLRNTGGPKGDKGDKGDTGATGPQGPQGNAATVSVGSTTTLPVGYDATVTNTGSIYNAVLDFGIPQGPQGPQGAKGDKGDTGAKGDTGPRGPQGERGTNATVYVGTTTTTNPGTQARVYNSGTDSNAVLNFEIPRGDVGPMPTIAQTTGQSTTEVMSQKATTDALNTKQNTIDSSHKLSADLVTDTTTTNKFVTASDKATWNAKQNALTAGDNITISGDTISATDTTYTAGNNIDITGTTISTPAIAPEVVAELPETGTEGKLYLTPKAHTTSTATGNPITISLGEDAGQVDSFQLDGDTYQQSYTGKNLLTFGDSNLSGSKSGITYGYNAVTQEWYLDGTAKSQADIQYPSGAGIDMHLASGVRYTTTGFYQSGAISNGSVRLFQQDSNHGWQGVSVTMSSAANSSEGFTPNTDIVLNESHVIRVAAGTVLKDFKVKFQTESGSTVSSYEPYVGGQPSPSPDYPQPIQTVTGEQTVTVEGKNKIKSSTTGSIAWSGTIVAYTGDQTTIRKSGNGGISAQAVTNTVYTPISANQTYTFSMSYKSGTISLDYTDYWRFFLYAVSADGSTSITNRWVIHVPRTTTTPSASVTFTPSEDFIGYKLGCYIPGSSPTTTGDVVFNVQLELGSTASSYAPYSKQTLPISLGSIELCKLGTYQDYIWKDGENWKVHKATGKYVYNNDLGENGIGSTYVAMLTPTLPTIPNMSFTDGLFWCNSYTPTMQNNTGLQGSNASGRIRVNTSLNIASSYAEVRALAAANNLTIHYPLATATDTEITNTALISQLEAIRTASLQNGANTITNTATGSNLAGDMEIGYYGFAPRNRYDKWLWLDINNEYEQIGE